MTGWYGSFWEGRILSNSSLSWGGGRSGHLLPPCSEPLTLLMDLRLRNSPRLPQERQSRNLNPSQLASTIS